MIVWCFHTRWRANMKTLNSEGVVKPGECVPASEAGTSCCNNRDYIALQFSHLRNNVSPIHSAGTDGAGSGKVDKAARIGPTLDFFDESFNCAAATEAGGCAENAFSRNAILHYRSENDELTKTGSGPTQEQLRQQGLSAGISGCCSITTCSASRCEKRHFLRHLYI